jgi:hypothetical protein
MRIGGARASILLCLLRDDWVAVALWRTGASAQMGVGVLLKSSDGWHPNIFQSRIFSDLPQSPSS